VGGMSVEDLDRIRRAEQHHLAIVKASERLTRLDIASLLSQPAPDIDWLWHGFAERGTVVQVHGDGGVGKSIAILAVVRAAAGGHPFLGHDTLPGGIRAVIIDGENATAEVHRRLERLDYAAVADRVRFLKADDAIFDQPDQAEQTLIAHITDQLAELCVLDSQRALWPGEENEAGPVRRFYSMLRRVANATGATIIVLHHDNKSGGYSGSTDLNAGVDSRLHLTRDDTGTITLTHEKCRAALEQEPITYRLGLEDGRYAFTLEDARSLSDDLLDALTREWQTAREIATAAGKRLDDVKHELATLTHRGAIEHIVGPPGRRPEAKCWRKSSQPADHLGSHAGGEAHAMRSHAGHTPVGGARGITYGREGIRQVIPPPEQITNHADENGTAP
jgi:hypothetical protein